MKKHNDPGLGDVFEFDEIIKPYHSAGTKSNPVKMTLEGLSGTLVTTNKIPPDIAGAVIFQTCYDIANNGLDFKGNGAYGSKWQELFNHIRNECLRLQNLGTAKQVATKLLEQKACIVQKCPSRTKKMNSKAGSVYMWFRLPRFNFIQSIIVIASLIFAGVYYKQLISWLIRVLNGLI